MRRLIVLTVLALVLAAGTAAWSPSPSRSAAAIEMEKLPAGSGSKPGRELAQPVLRRIVTSLDK